MRAIFDIESNGLLDTITKIHCLSYLNLDTKEIKSLTTYNEIIEFLTQDDLTLVGHNIICYDIPALEKILKIKIKAKLVDTLALSWLLFPTRDRHGLEIYGEEFGVLKPKIEDWENLPIEVYCNRCEMDCKINLKVWEKEYYILKELYDDNEDLKRYIQYVSFKMSYISKQQFLGLKLDKVLCESSLKELEFLKEEKMVILREGMPKKAVKSIKFYPKKFYNQAGGVSAIGLKWLEFLKEQGLPETHTDEVEFIHSYEEPNPNSHDQIKEWLYSLGWIPENIKHFRDKKKNEVRQIPQLKSKDEEGEICNSIKKLFHLAPALSALDDLFVISHRISIFKGFLENQKDGFLYQGCSGLTPTMRIQQSVLVNFPSTSKKYAENIRKCLIARDKNHILINSDLSGVEDATKRHFIYKYDAAYVEEMNTEGYDPHLAMAVEAGFLTKEQAEAHKNGTENYKEIRQKAKTANFALTYKVGIKTLMRSTGLSEKDTKKLSNAYWAKNKAILDIENDLKIKQTGEQKWILNPVSKFWLSLRNDKDKFSCLNQNTATYCFDLWIQNMINKGLDIPYFYHDEVLLDIWKIDKEETEQIIQESMQEVNDTLKLNVKISCGTISGNSYAETH